MPSILIVSKRLADETLKEMFVGAATSDRATAELLLEKLEAGPRVLSIKSNDAVSWPIFILEEPSGFSILGRDDVHASVGELMEQRPPAPCSEDFFLANLYFLSEQFIPNDVLRDSMGRIEHAHLSDLNLDELGPRVLDAWLKRT